jgi:hypothetical protein
MRTQTILLILAVTFSISCQSNTKNSEIQPKARKALPATIREVDFYNFTYETTNCSEEELEITVKNGQFRNETGEPGRMSLNVLDVTFGDLDDDKQDEAIVISTCNTGGSGNFSEGYVYKIIDGKPVRIMTFGGGDRAFGGLRDTIVGNGLLIVERNDTGKNGGACCPEFIVTNRYRLVENKLKEIGKEEKRKLEPPTQINLVRGKLSKTVIIKMSANEPTKHFVVSVEKGQTLTVKKTSSKASIHWADELKLKWTTRDKAVTEEENKLAAKLMEEGEYVFQIKNLTNEYLEIPVAIGLQNETTDSTGLTQSSELFSKSHVDVLTGFLSTDSKWRLATLADYDQDNLELLWEGVGRDYLPYYAFGDFNKDSQLDFAVIVVNNSDKDRYGLAVFNGPFHSGEVNSPAFFDNGLQKGDALFLKEKLIVGPYQSDNIFFLVPKGAKYELQEPDFGN